MSGKYCKIKTADDHPVSVAQVRQLRRNADWCMDSRKADIGTWGRIATDTPTAVSGTATTYLLSTVTVDLRHYDQVRFGAVYTGSGTATWTVVLSMTGNASNDVTLSLTNPGTTESSTGVCTPEHGELRSCTPQVTVTRTSGTGTLTLLYIGIWGQHGENSTHGPQLLSPALASDLQTAITAAGEALTHEQPLIGWFGEFTYPTTSTAALRWYALGDKNDDDEAIESVMAARVTTYEVTSAAGKSFTTTYDDNGGDSDSLQNNSSGVNLYHPINLAVLGSSYDTSTPWSGGKLGVQAQADADRPSLRAVGIHRTATTALQVAIEPGQMPRADKQIRTVEDTGAVGINDIAEYVHKCTWYQGGNVSGGMASGAGKGFTISTSYVDVFDGLIWVNDDAQSGSTWGSNTYQVAVRLDNGGASTDMTCRLYVDGQNATSTKTIAAGENYVLFEPAITGIDITETAATCKVQLLNAASRTITIYSVQISRRGGAY
jgi:hypothetical protein